MWCRKTSRRIAQTLLVIVSATGLLGQGLHLLTGVHGGGERHGTCLLACQHRSTHAHDCDDADHKHDHVAEWSTTAHANHDEGEAGIRGSHECFICQLLALAALNAVPATELPFYSGLWQRTEAQVEPPDSPRLLAYSGRAPPTVA